MADRGDNLDTPGKRFEWFIIECYGGVPAYVGQFGFNASQVYRTVSDSSSPRLETCLEYAATGVNIHWVTTGEGHWWAPNDCGRELAKKKGIVVTEGDQAEGSIDYAAIVDTIFEIAKEGVVEKLANQKVPIRTSNHPPSKSKVTKKAGR